MRWYKRNDRQADDQGRYAQCGRKVRGAPNQKLSASDQEYQTSEEQQPLRCVQQAVSRHGLSDLRNCLMSLICSDRLLHHKGGRNRPSYLPH